jgi:hypothetical protein
MDDLDLNLDEVDMKRPSDVPEKAGDIYMGLLKLKQRSPMWDRIIQIILPGDLDKQVSTTLPCKVFDMPTGMNARVKGGDGKLHLFIDSARYVVQFTKCGFCLPAGMKEGASLETYMTQCCTTALALIPETERHLYKTDFEFFRLPILLYEDGSILPIAVFFTKRSPSI